jgi:serine/threonine-protein kinase HipA
VEAGILQETDAREYVFTYDENYHGEPVCLSMPVRKEPYRSAHLFPYFFNMLSEYQSFSLIQKSEHPQG